MAAPDRSDLVWLTFTPQAGREQARREQAGRRSPAGPGPLARTYHQKTAYALVCSITSRQKGYPFAVKLPEGLAISSVVLADQLKSIDRHARAIEVVGKAPPDIVAQVRARLWPLLPA